MAMQDKRSRIGARWQTLQPGWGKDHSSELRSLYEVLQDDEEIEALVSLHLGPWLRVPGRSKPHGPNAAEQGSSPRNEGTGGDAEGSILWTKFGH